MTLTSYTCYHLQRVHCGLTRLKKQNLFQKCCWDVAECWTLQRMILSAQTQLEFPTAAQNTNTLTALSWIQGGHRTIGGNELDEIYKQQLYPAAQKTRKQSFHNVSLCSEKTGPLKAQSTPASKLRPPSGKSNWWIWLDTNPGVTIPSAHFLTSTTLYLQIERDACLALHLSEDESRWFFTLNKLVLLQNTWCFRAAAQLSVCSCSRNKRI